jgi:hypothetical protein
MRYFSRYSWRMESDWRVSDCLMSLEWEAIIAKYYANEF